MKTIKFLTLAVGICIFCSVGFGQTSDFNDQGKSNNGAAEANGNYDFQFELHNSLSSTTPLASATPLGVTVTNEFLPYVLISAPRFLTEATVF